MTKYKWEKIIQQFSKGYLGTGTIDFWYLGTRTIVNEIEMAGWINKWVGFILWNLNNNEHPPKAVKQWK